MLKKFILITCVLSVLTAANAFAEDVYTTTNGSKYHKETCRLLKNKEKAVKLDKEEAVKKGYEACKRCYKEDVVQLEKPSTTEGE